MATNDEHKSFFTRLEDFFSSPSHEQDTGEHITLLPAELIPSSLPSDSPYQLRQAFVWKRDIPNFVAWSPDQKILASASEDCTIKLWYLASDLTMRILEGHEGPVRSVAWMPGGRFIATASNDGTIKIWDVTVGNVQDALQRTLEGHRDSVTSVGWSPDGRWLASGAWDEAVKVWDRSSGKERATH
jgi:WD40 repeat protein